MSGPGVQFLSSAFLLLLGTPATGQRVPQSLVSTKSFLARPMTHKRNILLILLVTAAAFGNTLNNDFIGDSRALFANNSFYKKAANLPKLFSADLIMAPEQLEISPREERSFSGCISYRPVPALTFFIDYFV